MQGGGEDEEEGDDEDEDEGDDAASFASVDDLEDENEAASHKMELKKLAEQDPEFFKYLQENDKELLDFDMDDDDDEEGIDVEEDVMDDDGEEESKAPVLTKEILRRWQKAILEVSMVAC